MLATLRIKNLALVADLTLELQPGCNAITGGDHAPEEAANDKLQNHFHPLAE